MQPYTNEALYKALGELNVIDKTHLDRAFNQSQKANLSLANILIEEDLISDENLGKVISDLLSVPLVRLSKLSIPKEILQIVPEIVAKKHKMIAFASDKDGVKLAMANPKDTEICEFIAKKTGEKIVPYFATDADIAQTLNLYKKDLQNTFSELLKGAVDRVKEASEGKNIKPEDKEVSISKIVDLLIEYAYYNKASDIHIEPKDKESLVRFRIDGVLHDVLRLPRNLHDQVISRIKVLSKLRIDEHLSAQDGKMQMKLEEEDLDLRVSIVPVTAGEKAVLRLLSSRSRQFSLSDLGMSSKDLAKVRDGFTKPYGMVLSTGPTGAGKTTTIYAILKIINSREKNIATIEDPVEYEIEGVNQIQVNPKTNLTFAEGLRSILRQDPDIMFVGEIRDNETAGIAINSAMTGHLVLSTLHTNNASTALPRLIDMKIEPFLVASTVNVIIGQRLVRKICEKCRYSLTVKKEDLAKKVSAQIVKKHFGEDSEVRLYRGKGCSVCHLTGYIGRVGVFEVLEVSDAVRKLIVEKVDADVIQKKAMEEGMTTMTDDGFDKVVKGVTTIEEILRATEE